MEFYQWIHTELLHLVTKERAKQISIGKVISLSAKRYSEEYFNVLNKLFERVKSKSDFMCMWYTTKLAGHIYTNIHD